MTPDEKIIKILVDENKVEKKNLIGVFKIHQANKAPLEKLVVELKVAGRQDVLEAKAKVYKGEPLLIDISQIDMKIAREIPQAMAKRYNLICPNQTEDGRMMIAMHDPRDTFALEYVQMRTGKEVVPYVTLLADLEDAWEIIYAAESKKVHPFFTKPKDEGFRRVRKEIPKKFVIPSLSKKPDVVELNEETPAPSIKETTEKLREKSVDESEVHVMVDSIQNELEALSILSHSGALLNHAEDQDEVIKKILETGRKICKAEGSSLLLPETEWQYLYFKEVIGPKANQLLKLKIPLSEDSIAGWVVLNKTPLALNNVKDDPRHFKEVDEYTEYETRNIACVPLTWGEGVLGVIEMVNKSPEDFNEKDLEYLSILAAQASVAIHNIQQMEQFRNFYLEVVEILIDCLEGMDPVSKDHSVKVARLAAAISKQLGLSEQDHEDLCYAAFLHDIGKIKVHDNDECRIPVEGAQLLSRVDFFKEILPIVRHHREHFDGSGCPDGLQGEEIPTGARLLAIAYGYHKGKREKPDVDVKDYIEEFIPLFGSTYDPSLKPAFLAVVEEYLAEEDREQRELNDTEESPAEAEVAEEIVEETFEEPKE